MISNQERDHRALQQVLACFAATGVFPNAARALGNRAPDAARALRDAVIEEVPAFTVSRNPEILPGLDRHVGEHVLEIQRLLSGGDVSDFGFVKNYAHQRADQHFPLEVILHAYRCGQRVLSRWLRDTVMATGPGPSEEAVSAIADFAIEYTNAVSTIVASEYVTRARVLAETEGDQRTELLSVLLTGYDESDTRVARLLRRAGYLEQRRTYCVLAAQSVNPGEMELPARAQRIADALSTALAPTSVRMLCGLRNNFIAAVLSDTRRQSGWTAPQTSLAERVLPKLLLLGPAVLAGLSSDHPSTSFLPKALQEATIALDFANVEHRVMPFAGLPMRSLLVHRNGEFLRSTSPRWTGAFFDADAKAQGSLMRTLRAIADADLNVQKAARLLGKHPNTIYARIERIRALTGLDGQRYHDLTELLLASDCCRHC
jgi:DNA-binding PucR family transcriptional regulator